MLAEEDGGRAGENAGRPGDVLVAEGDARRREDMSVGGHAGRRSGTADGDTVLAGLTLRQGDMLVGGGQAGRRFGASNGGAVVAGLSAHRGEMPVGGDAGRRSGAADGGVVVASLTTQRGDPMMALATTGDEVAVGEVAVFCSWREKDGVLVEKAPRGVSWRGGEAELMILAESTSEMMSGHRKSSSAAVREVAVGESIVLADPDLLRDPREMLPLTTAGDIVAVTEIVDFCSQREGDGEPKSGSLLVDGEKESALPSMSPSSVCGEAVLLWSSVIAEVTMLKPILLTHEPESVEMRLDAPLDGEDGVSSVECETAMKDYVFDGSTAESSSSSPGSSYEDSETLSSNKGRNSSLERERDVIYEEEIDVVTVDGEGSDIAATVADEIIDAATTMVDEIVDATREKKSVAIVDGGEVGEVAVGGDVGETTDEASNDVVHGDDDVFIIDDYDDSVKEAGSVATPDTTATKESIFEGLTVESSSSSPSSSGVDSGTSSSNEGRNSSLDRELDAISEEEINIVRQSIAAPPLPNFKENLKNIQSVGCKVGRW